jgi:hypothetical protein
MPHRGKFPVPRRRNTLNFKDLFRNTWQQSLNGVNVAASLD